MNVVGEDVDFDAYFTSIEKPKEVFHELFLTLSLFDRNKTASGNRSERKID
jgi:hypothetical protein